MRRTILLASLLLVTPVLAGCATDTGTPTTTTPTGAATTTPTATTATSPTLTTPTITTPSTAQTIKVGTEAAYPPFEDTLTTGEIVGFDIDVMKEIANRSNLQVTFQNAAFQAIIPSIQSGQFDAGISAFTITSERREQVDFSVSYYDNELMVAVRSNDDSIKAEGDLKSHKVCTQTGTTSDAWLVEHGQPNESILRLDAFPPCVDALKKGDVDAMMIDRAVVREMITNSDGAIKQAFVIPTDEQFGIAVKKGNVALLTKINAALVAMKQDGTLQELADKWQV